MAWGKSEKGFEGTWANSSLLNTQAKPPFAFPDWDAKSQDEVLAEWEGRKTLLATAKEREMEFRKYVVSRAFPNPTEGTNTLELNNGYALKANIKYNYKLADNDTVEKTLDRIAKIGNNGPFIADRLVSWSASFLLTEYRDIQEEAEKGSIEAIAILKEINNMLTIENAAPSLEIKQGKKK